MQECPGERLGLRVAAWNGGGRKEVRIRGGEVMKATGKIREEQPVWELESTGRPRISQRAKAVKAHFVDSCCLVESRVPGATLRTMKATPLPGVAEGGIDDLGLRHAEDQFLD